MYRFHSSIAAGSSISSKEEELRRFRDAAAECNLTSVGDCTASRRAHQYLSCGHARAGGVVWCGGGGCGGGWWWWVGGDGGTPGLLRVVRATNNRVPDRDSELRPHTPTVGQ